MVPKKPDPGT